MGPDDVAPAPDAAQGHTVIALSSGRFVVLLPKGDENLRAILGADVRIDADATDLSIVPPYAMVLYGGGAGGAIMARRDRATTSRLDARRSDGTLAWRVELDFRAGQPPLDGGDRVYVVGRGIAAIGLDGKMLWNTQSTMPLRAAAFADGTLAVVSSCRAASSRSWRRTEPSGKPSRYPMN